MARSQARDVAQGDDTALNMTPMIDVCFQLIVFFMLTLRFPSAASRFETQLPHQGPQARPQLLEPQQHIVVKLFRKDTERAVEQHFTRVRVGETTSIDLPRGPWPRDGAGEATREAAEAARFAEVSRAIQAAWSAQGRDPQVRGEIRTPAPGGALVPHGDVMKVLDAFVEAGIARVEFEGAPSPLR